MAHKTVPLIMRMPTDYEFRFRSLAKSVSTALPEMGDELTREESDDLAPTDGRSWEVGPAWIDEPSLVVRARQWVARADQDHES